MASVTERYNIQGPVPFIDVDVAADTPLFVDPAAVRLSGGPQPFAREAVASVDSFFATVSEGVLSREPARRSATLALLQQFREPYETRLGMTRSGIYGHGAGPDIGEAIWEALNGEPRALLEVGMLRHLENLAMFVPGVDRDVTSDITTRIIMRPLAGFTALMLQQYPQFSSGQNLVHGFRRQVWDPRRGEWAQTVVEMPLAEGKPLLLVPKEWARRSLLMSAERFRMTTVLGWVQSEEAVRLPGGRVARTPKDRLARRADLQPGRETSLRVVLRAAGNGDDLISRFEAFVRGRLDRTA